MSNTKEEWEAEVAVECAKTNLERAEEVYQEVDTTLQPVYHYLGLDADNVLTADEFHNAVLIGQKNYANIDGVITEKEKEEIQEASITLNTLFNNYRYDFGGVGEEGITHNQAYNLLGRISSLDSLPDRVILQREETCGITV